MEPRVEILLPGTPKNMWRSDRIEKLKMGTQAVLESLSIRILKFKMADPIWRMISKSFRMLLQIVTFNVLRSLITILTIDFKNSKWRIQYDG